MNYNQQFGIDSGDISNNQQKNSSRSKRKDDDGSNGNKKQKVFINKSNQQTPKPTVAFASTSGSGRPPPLLGPMHQNPLHCNELKDNNNAKFFGPRVNEIVMDDMLFRFLYNIPANEKENQIRVCFHIELAHWFFLDFYCADNSEIPERLRDLVPCQQVGFPQFVRQVFYKCDYLEKWRYCVDKIISEFHFYKSHVPTYGVIMLDPSLNYILLVQGYYASKNSWGFPKGKINEDEVPLECALREAYEEVGFDARDHIKDPDKFRPLQHFFGETLVRLFLATGVPMDYSFKPHLRKEIRKICWFSIRDLPKFPKDNEGCARLGQGFKSNCFNGVIPFIKGICDFIEKERREQNKPKCTVLKSDAGSKNSAFQPVIPRASSQQKLAMQSPNVPAQNPASLQLVSDPSTSQRSTADNLFKPLKPDPASQPPTSFTGQSFLEHIGAAKSTTAEQIPKNPAGVIGGEAQLRRKEIKHPKPVHCTGTVVVVYEAPPEQSSPENIQQKDTQTHEIVDMLKSSISKTSKQTPVKKAPQTSPAGVPLSSQKDAGDPGKSATLITASQQPIFEVVDVKQVVGQFVPTQVHRCEAWKKFTLDRTRLQQI